MHVSHIMRLCLCLLLLAGCGRGAADDFPARKEKKTKSREAAPAGRYRYAVYLESSGSLNGYLNAPGSDFKSNVYGLIAGIAGIPGKEALDLFDINTKIIPVARQADEAAVSRYISNLDEATFRARSKTGGGDQSRSDLQAVFRSVLDSLPPDGVSILVTDAVFSPGTSTDAINYLNQQRSGIYMFFSARLRRLPFSTLVLQFSAGFKGRYYYQDNRRRDGSFPDRPYYIIAMGPETALQQLRRQFGAGGTTAPRHYAFFTPGGMYEVKPRIRIDGQYYEYSPDRPLTLTGAHKGGRDQRFRIRVQADYGSLPLEESYLTDARNYSLPEGYQLESVTQTGSRADAYELVLVADKPLPGKLTVSLRNKQPAWIEAASLDSDKGLDEAQLTGKTFGLRYLLGGIYDAYYAQGQLPDYFHFTLTVKE